MRRWRTAETTTVFNHPLIQVQQRQLAAGEDRRQALVLESQPWVNVIPLLPDGRVLLVRQWRFGIEAPTLEIPGGVLDPGEDDHTGAARELLEETGYRAHQWRRLGEVHANPAILNNRVSTWLATDLEQMGEPEGDGEEELELTSAPLAEIPGLIARGEISHSLVVAAFYLLGIAER